MTRRKTETAASFPRRRVWCSVRSWGGLFSVAAAFAGAILWIVAGGRRAAFILALALATSASGDGFGCAATGGLVAIFHRGLARKFHAALFIDADALDGDHVADL